jgi:hypothetical protein
LILPVSGIPCGRRPTTGDALRCELC